MVIVVYELQPKVFGQLAFLCVRLPNRGNSKYADLRTFTAQSSFLYSKVFVPETGRKPARFA